LRCFIGLTSPNLPLIYGYSPLYAAVLVCVEHSFWIVQQGSNPSDAFIEAWESYLKTRRALVDQELEDYLRSKGSDDWFTREHSPSDEERAECRKIVFNTLLRKFVPGNELELLI